MKKLMLFFVLFVPFSAFSQTKSDGSFRDVLIDNLIEYAKSDMYKYIDHYIQCSGKNFKDTVNVIYFRETVMISFNSEEYSELRTNYTKVDDGLKEKVLKMKTFQKLKQIDAAMEKGKLLYDLFENFVYKYSIRYEDTLGLDAEYRIKVDDLGMRIIGREIDVVLVSD